MQKLLHTELPMPKSQHMSLGSGQSATV